MEAKLGIAVVASMIAGVAVIVCLVLSLRDSRSDLRQTKSALEARQADVARLDRELQETRLMAVNSQRASQAILARVESRASAAVKSTKEIQSRVPPTNPAGDCRLDSDTVRMLDAQRTGFGLDSSAGGDEEGAAAAAVIGLREVVSADSDAVRAYNDLADRHNALVDFVERAQCVSSAVNESSRDWSSCDHASTSHSYSDDSSSSSSSDYSSSSD
ncbi:hypothetical protein [Chromobacterium sp. ASV23]|uniref:hypothetical protein n=1 Tax=Chromobacterium sp. ASV23 TaxID=2795110 RepID=UPI0018EC133A|nr:hypothetical protein [Chromobacterium sp. ASV23]